MADLKGYYVPDEMTTVDVLYGKNFDPIPVGKYSAMITDSEITQNKAGTGHILKLRYDIIDGEYTGRVIYENLNIDHPNEKARQMAYMALGQIQHSIGKKKLEDSQEAHDIPITIKVVIEPEKNGFPARNSIKERLPINGGEKASEPRSEKAPWE